jgi:hypothetical protein
MNQLTETQTTQLDQDGYTLLPAVLTPAEIDQLTTYLEQLWQQEGEEASSENYQEAAARRLANLANKGDIFRTIFMHPLVLTAAEHVIGPDIRLSMLNARDARPHSGGEQAFHCDTDKGGKPDDKGYYAFTAVWMLDDFTPENGATRIVPGSHRTGLVPREGMADIWAKHPQEITVSGRRGDVLIFNGHCWHAGGKNETDHTRRAILVHYLRAGIPRPENRRQHLSAEIQATMTSRELELLGLDEI